MMLKGGIENTSGVRAVLKKSEDDLSPQYTVMQQWTILFSTCHEIETGGNIDSTFLFEAYLREFGEPHKLQKLIMEHGE